MLPHLRSSQSVVERHRNMNLADEAHFSSTRKFWNAPVPVGLNFCSLSPQHKARSFERGTSTFTSGWNAAIFELPTVIQV